MTDTNSTPTGAAPAKSRRAYMIGGGIGSLAAAAFLIRDAGFTGEAITIFEATSVLGGALDGGGSPETGYSLRGGRMLTSDNYECTWDLFRTIPSIYEEGVSVHDETMAFNKVHVSHAQARLVDSRRARVPVASMGFSMQDRVDLLKVHAASDESLGTSRITDHFAPGFFETEFWQMWATTFAFQPWHSAAELRRYMHRFAMEFGRIETLAGVKRTRFNQYDALVRPLERWLADRGVRFVTGCTVTDIAHAVDRGQFTVTGLTCRHEGRTDTVAVSPDDLVFLQNGSMTDASSLGSMTAPPAKLGKAESTGWALWEKLAATRPEFGNPGAFIGPIAQTSWESFTVTMRNPAFLRMMQAFSGNEAGTGGLVTFRDSRWLMSIVIPHQPYFAGQPEDTQVFWGYALFPDRIGDFVAKPMSECSGAEILAELRGHLRIDPETLDTAICIPCWMPYITSMFMPRQAGDRPKPVPEGCRNLALVSQFVEIPEDVVFTVEYSVRAAQMAVYQLCNVGRPIPPVTPYDKSLRVQFEALVKAFK